MTTLDAARWARDIRALGAAAPIRAAYELSKRSGFHSILFNSRTARGHSSSRDLRLTVVKPLSREAEQRCLDDAETIVRSGVKVFGRRAKTGVHGPWSLDPLTGHTWPETVPWWKIDIRSEARMSDVKHVWEAGRHRDLVILARASNIDPEGVWIEVLIRALTSWCDQCPPEKGVHWYSSLELALRAIAWSQVLTLTRDRLPDNLVREMEAQLLASGRHLTMELPYTLSSMRNNHMLGDALGFLVLAQLFPGLPRSRRWQAVGNRMFNRQLVRHMRADGSMIEDSLSYHRFVLEMLVIRVLLGDAPNAVREALRGSSDHLIRLGVLEGEVPQYGDWDEGRVLASSADSLDVAGSVALGFVLSGGTLPDECSERYDELAWYTRTPAADANLTPVESVTSVVAAVEVIDVGHRATSAPQRINAEPTGGFSRASRGPWDIWFKVDGGPSHGHADLTSVWIKHEDQWIVSDPGTGTYNGSLDVRNGLRTSIAHPVLRPGGRDQLHPHRAFRWLRTARGFQAVPVNIGECTVLFGWHDAYVRDLDIVVARAVVVADAYVAIIDAASNGPGGFELTVPLHPQVEYGDSGLVVPGRRALPVFGLAESRVSKGRDVPFSGWHSDTYGTLRPSTWLSLQGRAPLHIWGFGHADVTLGDMPRVESLLFKFSWSPACPELLVTDLEGRRTCTLRAPT